MKKGVYDLWVTPWVATVSKGRRLEYQVLVADARSGIYTSHGTHMGQGGVAQSGAQVLCKHKDEGSIPSTSSLQA